MIIVVDTKILFSIFLSNNSLFKEILLHKDYEFITPNFIFIELFKHKQKILKHSKLTETELLEFMNTIVSRIRFISHDDISRQNFAKAIDLCDGIDLKDTVFVALALELDALLWTGDRRLKEGLQSKGFNRFFDTSNFL